MIFFILSVIYFNLNLYYLHSSFDVGKDKTRVCALSFDREVHPLFELDTYDKAHDMVHEIDDVNQKESGTHTGTYCRNVCVCVCVCSCVFVLASVFVCIEVCLCEKCLFVTISVSFLSPKENK